MNSGSPTKFVFAVFVASAALISKNIAFILMTILLSAIALYLWTGRSRNILRALKMILPIFAFIFMFHLFSHPGDKLFSIFTLKATGEGAYAGFYYGAKLFSFALCAFIILKAVDPFSLVRPVERLAKRFGQAGRILSFIALALSLALRFIPELTRQAKSSMLALNTRGVFLRGGFSARLKAAVILVGVVFVNAFKSAESVAQALGVKGYSTRYRRAVFPPVKVSYPGMVTFAVSLAILICGWWI